MKNYIFVEAPARKIRLKLFTVSFFIILGLFFRSLPLLFFSFIHFWIVLSVCCKLFDFFVLRLKDLAKKDLNVEMLHSIYNAFTSYFYYKASKFLIYLFLGSFILALT